MRTKTLVFLLLLLLGAPAFAADFNATSGSIALEDGDSFVFIGDSITHQCLYTQYVEDYFYTRHPDKRIRFHNAGVSGDRAVDVLRRFEEDIASFKPKYASILIGMNDGRYTDFKDEIIGTYKQDMTATLDRLAENETQAIIMTPTMFDLRQAMRGDNWLEAETVKAIHYNATLSFFGMWGLQQANERGLGFVDMFGPLNKVTRAGRVTDADFTLIRDAVHPEADGQLVMALALIEDIGADTLVSRIHLDQQNGQWVGTAENGTITDLDQDTLSFSFTANSLPWVVPEEGRRGYVLTDAGTRMSRELFQVTGLEAGRYTLSIDNTPVGTYGHVALAEGIELQENDKTPQYAQSLEVALVNKEKNEEAVNPLRDLWLRKKIVWYRAQEDDDDEEEKEDVDWLEPGTTVEEWTQEFPNKVADLLEKIREYDDRIYAINTPSPHVYKLSSTE